ncbi:hypothetical protein M501DRAFT_995906 [Patellaria atrata CBS 101060]|uniref:Uncharacterized protein n=1 Tax=Patellaria atrata CBS 101060 TaxID=1346257 RepID=A0A9P4S937_9PEZI|nr:hypothetical protein M501DRAFT_995906 [Patellaria atrata CBS 101060]
MDPAVPPGPDDSVAPRLLGVVTPLWGLSIIAFVARITTRSYPVQRLGWDDFFIVLAAVGHPCGNIGIEIF